ncbi:MAG: RNA-binding protein [Candidatus Levybacteria bacterium RIFCSPHIGHO2_02_FULL_40_18]|nr:MAG: RNA-binding protein [Candidatus Levybacteria bacterium RIFCSPHIGHO2_01_FULL_40_58]OGH26721.1 MAG: RNA-binding protein [Candidatus Levybacteria bacterium RIFCSPHIGHO2_02_FULL_40_18]OGH31656.1 MAG: RNA-binding protein [Candidatus Levybacteria bacterium RIFCSPHIGHO2_12_FULL_40_31]OGH40556.1 MAG: RNA-binding protein [Candidatus Levybacteria bacterium RIFCSPLOWO2_01_FULL_40_64]OGH48732.1 MAG: RNA-binding protein [Candidatus Levybacteria bacterium RIFCSPLOWO2_02_FULL_41_11]OGH53275.1 MAG: RN
MAKKLFVGGLAWATTDDSLSSFFSKVGNVASANVVKDRYTGKSRGFGFVEMSTDEEADKAIAELNGQTLDERAISVSEARPREPRNENRGFQNQNRTGQEE